MTGLAHDQQCRIAVLRGITARVAGLCLAACCVSACFTASEAEERAMGASDAARVDSLVPFVRDTAITRFVADLGRSLAVTTNRAGLDWRFAVVDAPEVNAFALPGGYVYVTRGLIEMVDSLDQLAGVMAHEIGHIVQRHSVEQLQKDQRRDAGLVLLCTLTDLCNTVGGSATVQLGADALMARYSQKDEIEADSEAVVIACRAGFDPEGVPSFFAKMLEQRTEQPTLVDVIFSTHPTDQTRISRVRRQIAGLGALPDGLLRDAPELHAIQARSRVLPPAQPLTAP